jgi:hypothetical protein
LFQTIGFRVDVVIVEQDWNFARGRRTEICRGHHRRLSNLDGLQVGRVVLQSRLTGGDGRCAQAGSGDGRYEG